MQYILWFGLSFFAAVGAVQVAGWISCHYLRPEDQMEGCQIIPLNIESETLEAQVRHCLRLRSWSAIPEMLILLAHRELDDEGAAILDRLIGDSPGVILCYPWELEKLLTIKSEAD